MSVRLYMFIALSGCINKPRRRQRAQRFLYLKLMSMIYVAVTLFPAWLGVKSFNALFAGIYLILPVCIAADKGSFKQDNQF